MPFIWSILKE